MYAALRRAAPLRRPAVSALAAAVLPQQPAASVLLVPRQQPLPTLPAAAAAAAAWFHSAPAWLGFRETGPAGAAARPEFAAPDDGPFYDGATAAEGLEIAKLGISSQIVDRLARKGITKLFPIQLLRRHLSEQMSALPKPNAHRLRPGWSSPTQPKSDYRPLGRASPRIRSSSAWRPPQHGTMAIAGRDRASMLLRAIVAARRSPASTRCIHEGPDTIDELLDRHLVKKPTTVLDDDAVEAEARRRLTSSRREALSLYRDIIRATRLFVWLDPRGVPWGEVLRANARREFEEAREERDPEVVTRLLIGGRDALQQMLDRLADASRRTIEAEEAKRRGGA
ncbi:hypothetical protein BS78_08G144000 [Paspalum vaginatum]|nr:hypothetical protein BS78_08G144000 [Paspalum vaginatum]